MISKLFIHAVNIHQGGGRSLLTSIFDVSTSGIKLILNLDVRMPTNDFILKDVCIKRVKPTIACRFFAEIWLKRHVKLGDYILCMGNLPPLFKLSGHVAVFVQNRYLVDYVKLNGFSIKTKFRLWLERVWLANRLSNVNEFYVQTPTMKCLLENLTRGKVPVKVLPFVAEQYGYVRKLILTESALIKDFDFAYVASGEPHKNHRQLIEAWCLLASEGQYPSLRLTVDKTQFAELHAWMARRIDQHRLNVENLGSLPHDTVKRLYAQTRALIYPSTFESFGLPLIEARQAGLPVLAPELDYVRDVLDPDQTFDPDSAVSIARAVKRFMGLEEAALPLHDAAGFLQHILQGQE